METIAQIFASNRNAERPLMSSSKIQSLNSIGLNQKFEKQQPQTLTTSQIEQKFRQRYPTDRDVISNYMPDNWTLYLENKAVTIASPCITFRQLNALYDNDGLAKAIVKNNLAGVYMICSGKDAALTEGEKMLSISAPLMLRTFGMDCDLNTMMVYFGSYCTEYKSAYKFDLNELQGCYTKKFLPYWEKLKQRTRDEQKREWQRSHRDLEPVGQEAKMLYLRDKVLNGEDLRSGGLYDYGQVSEAEIKQAEEMAKLFKSTVQFPPISEPEPQFPESSNVNDWPF